LSVLVEAITVIFKNSKIEERIQGGVETIRLDPPNSTFRTDGLLCAVGFMDPGATEQFVKTLSAAGLVFIEDGQARDIAVLDQHRGLTSPCDWVEFTKLEDGTSCCWLAGHPMGELATYENWTPHTDLTFNEKKAVDSLKFIREENSLDVYLDLETGKEIFHPHSDTNLLHREENALTFKTMVKNVYEMLIADGWYSIVVKTKATDPFHLVMRYRNQLCVVFVEVDWQGRKLTPFTAERKDRFLQKAEEFTATPLVSSFKVTGELPDGARSVQDTERSNCFGFTSNNAAVFQNLNTGKEWSAEECDFDEEIVLSKWEIHDFGIDIVKRSLEEEGHQIEYFDSSLDAAPHIVAVINGIKTNILVDTASYPKRTISFDQDLCRNLMDFSAKNGCDFKTASVYIASPDDPFDPENQLVVPVYRGQQARIRYEGLETPPLVKNG
jgi:hypothetical protein